MLKRLQSLNQKLLKYEIASIILAIPLYPKFPFLTIPGSQVSLRLEDFLLFFVLISWLFTLKGVKNIFVNPLFRIVFLFWLVGLVSCISAIFLTQSVVAHIAILHWLRRIQYMSVLFVVATSAKSKDMHFYIKCILLVIVFACFYGIGQKYFEWPVITTQNAEYAKGIALRYMPWGHLVSTFAGHYDLASYLILVLPMTIALLVGNNKVLSELRLFQNTFATRVFLLVVAAMGYWLLLQTASRISFVSYIGSTFLILILINRFKLIPLFLIISLVFASFSSNLVGRYSTIFEVTMKKIMVVVVPPVFAAEGPIEDRSTSIRLNVEWPRAVRALTKNPLLGTGYSSISLATDNDYLRMLGEVGLLGSFAFTMVVFRFLKLLVPTYPFKSPSTLIELFGLALLASIPGVLLNMVFIDILEASKFAISLWLFVGLAISIYKNEEYV